MVDARVIQTPFGFRVLPHDVFKRSGDGFTLLNNTSSTIHVSFPVLPTTPADADIAPGSFETFTILATPPDIYEYRVEITMQTLAGDFMVRASGGSDPNIIIDF
jgi:hypothetical protein